MNNPETTSSAYTARCRDEVYLEFPRSFTQYPSNRYMTCADGRDGNAIMYCHCPTYSKEIRPESPIQRFWQHLSAFPKDTWWLVTGISCRNRISSTRGTSGRTLQAVGGFQ